MATRAVELLALGAQSSSGTGAAVATDADAILRMDIRIQADMGKGPWCDVWLETSPTETAGPWKVAFTRRFDAVQPSTHDNAWPASSVHRVPPFTADNFARVRWNSVARQNSTNSDPGLSLGVSGFGVGSDVS